MAFIDRVKNILLQPKTEWQAIAAEATPPKDLVVGYVLPLAAAAAIVGLINAALIGSTGFFGVTVRIPIMWALVAAVYHVIMAVVAVFVVGFIVDALAPSFGAQKNLNQAIKVPAYAFTASWVGGVLAIVPFLGVLFWLIGALYACYLLYLGLPRVMKNPEEKSAGYAVVVILVTIVVMWIVMIVGGLVTAPAMLVSGALSGGAPTVTYEKGSTMGKLDEFAKKMDEAGKKMEAAQKSGDPQKQMEAAMATLGTAISGGKAVEPVQLDALKPFLPATFAGLPQTSTQSERSGVTGFMVAKVEARYGDAAGKNAEVEVTDTGGAAGLMGLASWIGIQGERENADRREATRREGNRMIHEEIDKRGGRSKYTVVLGDRFVVSVAANGVDLPALKSAVNSIDLAKLEAMK